MNIVDKFERKTRILIRDLTMDDMTRIMADEGYSDFFSDDETFLELSEGIIKRNSDPQIVSTLKSARMILVQSKVERDILQLFTSYRENELTRDELKEKVVEEINSSEPIQSLIAIACSLVSLQDLMIEKEKILKTTLDILNYITELSTDPLSYSAKCGFLDLIFSIRTRYFELHSTDYFDSKCIEITNKELDFVHKFEDKFFKIKKVQTDIPPEMVGLIDITKLRKE